MPTFLLYTIKATPKGTNIYQGNGVITPRSDIAAPTIRRTLSIDKSCPTISSPSSPSLEALTNIPVESDISNEGIWLQRPSPIVRIVYFCRASVISSPPYTIPMIIPPTILIPVIIRPAVASPFTYLVAPSIEPKKLFSFWSFCLFICASLSVIAPVLRSESIAICLPAIASSVNLAVTSATLSEPLFITIN